MLQHLINFIFSAGQHHFLNNVVREEIHEVEVGHIFVHAVANIYIVEPVIIRIKHQCAPAPVGGIDPAVIGYFRKCSVSIVQLHTVFHELVIKAKFKFGAVHVYIVKSTERFESVIVLGQHVRCEHIGVTIVIDVCKICTHR